MRLSSIIGWIWLVAFANAVLPKSVLHAFHAHEETHCLTGELTFAKEHTHCDFLNLQLAAYEPVEQTCIGPVQLMVYHLAALISTKALLPALVERSSRGPPFC